MTQEHGFFLRSVNVWVTAEKVSFQPSLTCWNIIRVANVKKQWVPCCWPRHRRISWRQTSFWNLVLLATACRTNIVYVLVHMDVAHRASSLVPRFVVPWNAYSRHWTISDWKGSQWRMFSVYGVVIASTNITDDSCEFVLSALQLFQRTFKSFIQDWVAVVQVSVYNAAGDCFCSGMC